MRLDHVLYVLELKSNILILGQFVEHGSQILMECGFHTIYDLLVFGVNKIFKF